MWKAKQSEALNKELTETGYEHDKHMSSRACERSFKAKFDAEVSAIEEAYSSGEISESQRVHRLSVAEDNFRSSVKYCG